MRMRREIGDGECVGIAAEEVAQRETGPGTYGRAAAQDRQREGGAATRSATTQPEVVMYATTWCGYCARARAFFAEHGISYVELDIERDARAEQMNRLLGGGGIPTILVGKDGLVHGFDEPALSRMLGPWMRTPTASSR